MLYDALTQLLGQQDPRQQIAAALGQNQGQPGGPAGVPVGGGGQPQGGAGAPAGGGQIPQAMQSPPDLMRLYMQLQGRQQNAEMFNRGLAGISAAFEPPSVRPAAMHQYDNIVGGAGDMMRNLVALQQYSQEQAIRQNLIQNMPTMLSQAGLSPTYQALALTQPDFLAKVVEAQMGVSGDPVQRELAQSRKEWHNQNPGQSDAAMIQAKPELAGPIEFATGKSTQTADALERVKAVTNDKQGLAQGNDNYTRQINDVDRLLQMPGIQNIIGPPSIGKAAQYVPGTQEAAARAELERILATTYVAGVQDFKGVGARVTQSELNRDAPSQSIMNSTNLSFPDWYNGVMQYRNKLATRQAEMFGSAGELNKASDEQYALINDIYKPGGSLFYKPQKDNLIQRGNPQGKQLDASDIAMAKEKLAHGDASFIAAMKAQGYDISPILGPQ